MAKTQKEWNQISRKGGEANGIHNYIRGEILVPSMREAGIPPETTTFDTKTIWALAQRGRIIICIEVRKHEEPIL